MKKIFTAVVLITAMASMAFAQNAVTFQVNMGKQVTLGNFDPNADTLYVSGAFNGWGTDNPIPRPAGNDSVWVVTVPAVGLHQIQHLNTNSDTEMYPQLLMFGKMLQTEWNCCRKPNCS
ncbi:MAG: hypothetical protein IPJ75_17300 [Ignavibacteriales bacterium]|nr:hypothetical protein [Ignavibacteriales bacterium]